jgi:acetyltransferase-like isoleucine patch superfamily enzyme
MTVSSIWRALSQQIKDNGLVWGGLLIAAEVVTKLRSRLLGVVLGAPDVHLGSGCRFQGIRFMRFGRGVRSRGNLWMEAISQYGDAAFTPRIAVGDRVVFSNAVHISAIHSVEIGNRVLFGSGVFISDHNHGAYAGSLHSAPGQAPEDRALHTRGAVVIEDNVWFGDNVNVVGPARIGFGAVIAANSVVRGDVPACSIVAGAPARVVKVFDEQALQWVAVSGGEKTRGN